MSTVIRSYAPILLLGILASLAAGCRGTTVVASNLSSLCIAVVLLWSTLQMNRDE